MRAVARWPCRRVVACRPLSAAAAGADSGTSPSAASWSRAHRFAPDGHVLGDVPLLAEGAARPSGEAAFNFGAPFAVHQSSLVRTGRSHKAAAIDFGPTSTVARREDLLRYYEQMATIRRLEVTADALYKQRAIRGFCHLAIGQEAIPVGIEAAIAGAPGGARDAIITAYRCHGFTLLRGGSPRAILAELLGRATGVSGGIGGSMHMYGRGFFGGNGIVGAQVPLGAGIAFAQWYRRPTEGRAAPAEHKRTRPAADEQDTGVTFALYGDGAANQGQIHEAFNIAALLGLPVVFVCENNFYGMGTSIERSSASVHYYERGDYLPGIRVDAMDVLAVREAAAFARAHALRAGPLVLEMVTYRYGGHSMSDPGTAYRPRAEVQSVRAGRDALRLLARQIEAAGFADGAALAALERTTRVTIEGAAAEAARDAPPEPSRLYANIFAPEHGGG